MTSEPTPKRCRCHSSYLYDTTCPACGHNSFDDYYRHSEVKGWAGCERRACGYERLPQSAHDPHTNRSDRP